MLEKARRPWWHALLGWSLSPLYIVAFGALLLHEAYRWMRPGRRALAPRYECGWGEFSFPSTSRGPDTSLGVPIAETRSLPQATLETLPP